MDMSLALITALALATGTASDGDVGPWSAHFGSYSATERPKRSIPPTISGSRGRCSRLSAKTGS